MTELPPEIFRKWNHSFEEDTDAETVYRPANFPFPRARGRAGIEFQANGEFIDWTIGATDAQRETKGQWRMEGPGYVAVFFEGQTRNPRVLEIVQCDEDLLIVRQRAASS